MTRPGMTGPGMPAEAVARVGGALSSEADWDALLLGMPAPHLLQSWAWGELKSRWAWQVERIEMAGPGVAGRAAAEIAPTPAAAQLLWRRVAGTPFRVGYVPKGPALADPDEPAAWSAALARIEAEARRLGLTQIKIDPDVPKDAEALASAWRRRGWRPSEEQIQFPNTMESDLGAGEAGLLAAMKPKTRYNIRLAERRGVTIRYGGAADLDCFFELYAETGRRGGFGLRTKAYYIDAWSSFLARDRAALILAEHEGRALAGVFPVAFGSTAWYLYGASTELGREHMPAYLAQWESLRWALARGCRRYDWWGGPSVLDASDPLWGVYRFKAGFGARLVEQLGAWDFAPVAWRYALYRRMARLRAVWLRRRADRA